MTECSGVVMSGSTRAASTNTAFARTAAAHPPAGATVTAWTDLTGLPHFDPDLDRAHGEAPNWPRAAERSGASRSEWVRRVLDEAVNEPAETLTTVVSIPGVD